MGEENPENRKETGRNADGTFKSGVSGNPGGRPKDSLKDYLRKKLSTMTDEQKEEWLKVIPKELQWRMGEGNPSNATELTGKDGEPLFDDEQRKAGKKAVGDFLTKNTEQGEQG